jgi:hypothetical protein
MHTHTHKMRANKHTHTFTHIRTGSIMFAWQKAALTTLAFVVLATACGNYFQHIGAGDNTSAYTRVRVLRTRDWAASALDGTDTTGSVPSSSATAAMPVTAEPAAVATIEPATVASAEPADVATIEPAAAATTEPTPTTATLPVTSPPPRVPLLDSECLQLFRRTNVGGIRKHDMNHAMCDPRRGDVSTALFKMAQQEFFGAPLPLPPSIAWGNFTKFPRGILDVMFSRAWGNGKALRTPSSYMMIPKSGQRAIGGLLQTCMQSIERVASVDDKSVGTGNQNVFPWFVRRGENREC